MSRINSLLSIENQSLDWDDFSINISISHFEKHFGRKMNVKFQNVNGNLVKDIIRNKDIIKNFLESLILNNPYDREEFWEIKFTEKIIKINEEFIWATLSKTREQIELNKLKKLKNLLLDKLFNILKLKLLKATEQYGPSRIMWEDEASKWIFYPFIILLCDFLPEIDPIRKVYYKGVDNSLKIEYSVVLEEPRSNVIFVELED